MHTNDIKLLPLLKSPIQVVMEQLDEYALSLPPVKVFIFKYDDVKVQPLKSSSEADKLALRELFMKLREYGKSYELGESSGK